MDVPSSAEPAAPPVPAARLEIPDLPNPARRRSPGVTPVPAGARVAPTAEPRLPAAERTVPLHDKDVESPVAPRLPPPTVCDPNARAATGCAGRVVVAPG